MVWVASSTCSREMVDKLKKILKLHTHSSGCRKNVHMNVLYRSKCTYDEVFELRVLIMILLLMCICAIGVNKSCCRDPKNIWNSLELKNVNQFYSQRVYHQVMKNR